MQVLEARKETGFFLEKVAEKKQIEAQAAKQAKKRKRSEARASV